MNKIIAIAAAMVAGVSMAQGIESANIVGYNNSELPSIGAKGMGASFVPVNGGSLKLGDLKVSGYGDEYADFQIQAQQLDTAGRSGTTYYWCDFEEEGETYVGWFDEDMNNFSDLELTLGVGLWIFGNDASLALQSAGSVANSDIAVTLGDVGAMMIVNPMPCTLTLGEISVTGYGEEYADFQIQAQKLDSAGRSGTTYYWCDFEEEGETYVGWFDEDMNDYNDVELAAGEGIWVYSNDNSLQMVFPTPHN